MEINSIINIASAVVLSIGSSSLIIIGLSSWLGKVWAARILEKDKLKYKSEFEKIKSSYEKEIENYKSELDKSKSLFFRYSESQFNLYNDLWGTLCKLESTVDDLWDQANGENLLSFALHLDKTINRIKTHRLLIEDDHYEKLKKILDTLNKFRLGKTNLIRMRQMTKEQIKLFKIDKILEYIDQNRESKDQFEELLEIIVKDFKTQIRANKIV